MTMINLTTKGDYTVCCVENKGKFNYVTFTDIKDLVHKLCLNYTEIRITEKYINISDSKIELNIEDYKNNTNITMEPIIRKLRKEYRELKKKRLRKQKIKRISALSCAVIISGSVLVNALSTNNEIHMQEIYENNNPNIVSTIEEIEESYVEEEQKEDNIVMPEENATNINNFEINFESRVDSEKFRITKAYYNQMITNISNEYGIDPKIMLAIATQESGIHNPDLKGSAIGLMQIERAVWNGEKISAYNYAKGINETLNITEEKLEDLEFNIRISCMILKDCLIKSNYNLPVAIQMYNFGYGNINKVFKSTYGENINFKEMCIDCDNSWLENRENIKEGDNKYLERILSYIEDLEDIQIKKGDEIVSYNFINRVKTL